MLRKKIMCTTVILIVFCSGCRLTYVFHAAAGQFRLLHGAIPVEEALKHEAIGTEQKEQLRLVARIKEFGEKELGLKKTRSYETVYLKSPRAPVYTVSACPKDHLKPITWWFPIVGDMPYLGFFDLEKAKSEKEKLIDRDLDVTMSVADAYSTLGWFRDPVTMNLVEGSTMDLVEIILHEMTHTTLYIKGQGEFNEGLAVLVGKVGAFLFFDTTYGPTHPLTIEAQKSIEDEYIFCSFINSLLEKLERLYDSSLSYREKLDQRQGIFTTSLEDFGRLRNKLQTNRFMRFGSAGLNNAYLMSVGLYHRNFHLFESVLNRKGASIKETIAFFRDLSREEGNMLAKVREFIN